MNDPGHHMNKAMAAGGWMSGPVRHTVVNNTPRSNNMHHGVVTDNNIILREKFGCLIDSAAKH